MQLYLFLILVHKLKLSMAKIYLPEENFSTEEKLGSDIFVVKLAETQKIRNDMTHLMNTSEEYGAPFRSIDVTTLKTFAEANGDLDKNLHEVFSIPRFENKTSREEQIKSKSVTKRIHFIRHGEGFHNVACREWRLRPDYIPGTEPYKLDTDPEYHYIDALLTPKGEKQAIALQDYIVLNCQQVSLLVLSPMRRATQTGLLAFTKLIQEGMENMDSRLKIIAKEEAHERSYPHTCDRRLDVKDLKSYFYEKEASKYGDMLTNAGLKLDYSEILSESDPYWGNGLEKEELLSVAKRGCKLMKWIYETNDMEVAIAAHSCLLETIFETVVANKSETDTWFATGEIKSCDVTFNLV